MDAALANLLSPSFWKEKEKWKVATSLSSFRQLQGKWKTLLASPVPPLAAAGLPRRAPHAPVPSCSECSPFPSLLRRAGHMEPISPVTLKSRCAPAFRHGAPDSPRPGSRRSSRLAARPAHASKPRPRSTPGPPASRSPTRPAAPPRGPNKAAAAAGGLGECFRASPRVGRWGRDAAGRSAPAGAPGPRPGQPPASARALAEPHRRGDFSPAARAGARCEYILCLPVLPSSVAKVNRYEQIPGGGGQKGGGSGVPRDPKGCQCPVVRVSGPCKLPPTTRASPSDAESHLLRQHRRSTLRRLPLIPWQQWLRLRRSPSAPLPGRHAPGK
uniref:Homeobox B3 n=1 Tax=Bos mutus grunniens TaxID=30521 RepID=A0A8C0AID2_BOSMU